MSTIQETTQNNAVAAGASASNSQIETDPDLFAHELETKLGANATARDKIAATMERLASAFPGVTVSGSNISGFGEVREYYLKTDDAVSINVGTDMLSQMAEDDSVFDRVKNMISNLMNAGQQQNLVSAGGSDIHRNVNVQAEEVRYVEVQRTATGSQLSVASLALEMETMASDLLEMLFGNRSQNSGTMFGVTNSQSTGFSFQNLAGNTSSWRLEAVLSAQGAANVSGQSFASQGINQLVSQTRAASIEVVIQQWSASSASTGASGSDLLAYIQMMGLSDPLVLDLGDEGINLKSAEEGVYFDIKGDGSPVRTAFVQGNNALLYLDENGNGVADNAGELFGDYGGFANGYDKLAQYDDNGDGVIDENDAVYSQLRVWRDLNGDGVNQEDESMTLAEAGIASLSLKHDGSKELDANGNVIADRSTFTRTNGKTGLMAEAWFRTL